MASRDEFATFVSGTTAEPAPLRLAATLLLVRDRAEMEVLMIQRHAGTVFGSSAVFPGGLVCDADRDPCWGDAVVASGLAAEEVALRIAGWREAFEEAGQLPFERASGATTFGDAVRLSATPLDLNAMVRFAHWVTPETQLKRYDTHFYLVQLEHDQEVRVDGREATAGEWIVPQRMLDRAGGNIRQLPFPTQLNLMLLARHSTTAEALNAARSRPVPTIMPRRVSRPEGVFITIPEGLGYPVTQMQISA